MASLRLNPSALGFGAFKIGRNRGIKYPQDYDLPAEREAAQLLNGVLDLGINYIDTAPAYGLSEARIGRALPRRRDDCLISTKVGETFDDGVSSYNFDAESVRNSVQRSRSRLQVDRLDLVFIHAARDDLAVLNDTDAVRTLQALRDEGLVRAIGFSGYTGPAFRAALAWADAVMVTYHAEDRALEPVIEEAAAQGVAVMVKKGLASGRLPPAEAIPFVLSNPGVTSMVVGGLNLDHITANLRIAGRVRGAAAASPERSVPR